MDIYYIEKYGYEIQEKVPVWYTGIYLPNSTTGNKVKEHLSLCEISSRHQNDGQTNPTHS
jgi:hypothetical protein